MFHAVGLKAIAATEMSRDGLETSIIEERSTLAMTKVNWKRQQWGDEEAGEAGGSKAHVTSEARFIHVPRVFIPRSRS